MAEDQRIRAVGDLDRAWDELLQKFEQAKKKTGEVDTVYTALEKTLKLLVEETLKYKKALDSLVEPKTMKGLRDQQEMFEKIAGAIQKVTNTQKKFDETAKERERAIKQETRLREKLESTLKGERDEIIKLQEETRRATKVKRDEVKATLDLDDAYQTLVNDTNKARNEFKRLAVQHGVNSKEAKEAKLRFELLDGELREVNAAAKDGTRDVGRYGDAIRGVRDTTLKWAAAITGAAASLVGLFKLASSQDELNKRLAGSFNLTGEALSNQSKQVEFLSKAYDTEVNDVIETATALTNEFNIESGKAFNLIQQGFEKGANVRGEFLEQLKEYSTQFVNVGLSAEQAIAVITQQENKGVFSDKGVDAIKEAGIRLTEMPKATEEALKAIGLSGKEIQEQITSGQKTVFEVTQEISREIAKLPPNAKEVGTVLADVFGGAGEDAKGFVLNLGDLSTELDGLEDKTTKFERAKQKLLKRFVDIKQEVSQRLIPVFTFLSENLGTIVSVGAKLIAFFGVYKARIAVLNALNGKFGASLKNIAEAFKKGETNGKRFSGGLKAIGSTLKNIGWAAAIAGAVKLAQAFWDVASGARQARQDAQLLDAVVGKFNAKVQEGLDARQKELDQQLELAKTEEDRKKLKEDFIKQNEKEINTLEKVLEKNKQALELAKKAQKEQSSFLELSGEFVDQGLEFFGGDLRDINDIVGEYEAKVAATEGGIKTLSVATQDAKHSLEVFNKEISEGSGSLGEGNDKLKERESLLREIEDAETDLIKNSLEREKRALDVKLARDTEDIEKSTAVEEEKAELKRLINEQYLRDINKLQSDADKARLEEAKQLLEGFKLPTPEVQKAEDFGLGIEEDYNQRRYELLLDRAKSEEQVEAELTEYRIELLEREIDIRKELELDAFDFEVELAELRRQKQEEEREKWLQAGKDALKNLGSAAKSYTDERIKEQEKLIASEEKLLETLQNAAQQGTLEQGQSIARQQQAVRDAQQEKIRLEKQQQAVEFATAAITTFTNALEKGKTVPEAFADVALSQAGLELILNTLPKFFHGTEDTGTKGLFNDQFGAVTGVTHKNERVITAEDNKRLQGKDNKSVVDAAVKYFEIENTAPMFNGISPDAYAQMLFIPQMSTPVYDDDRMIKRMESLSEKMEKNTKAIQNIKIPYTEIGRIMATAFEIIDYDGKGNSLKTIIHQRQKQRRRNG